MITINDNDLPITAAEKIITGTKPFMASALQRAFAEACGGIPDNQDMFTIEEIAEIADYLKCYCSNHKDGD